MFKKILIANRGEIACRIIKSVQSLNCKAVAIYSDADADASHVIMADEAFHVGAAPAKESYLDADKILQIMIDNDVEAVHPGYGFLSENVDFCRACEAANIAFIGPEVDHILEFGLKHRARDLAETAGVPLVPGTGLLKSADDALAEAATIGYPIILKSTAGGGGIGMTICASADELAESFETIKRLGKNYFKDDGVFLEKYIETSRHIEVQVFGDGKGGVAVLGERDCSVQRRNQKVIEETPAPGISDETRAALHEAAQRLAATVNYRSAGTVEFIYDTADETFYFLEVNTRLQVEHGITEQVFGVDLVRWMIELAAGENPIENLGTLTPTGCSMEFRVYAEDPGKDYQPSSGVITHAAFPENIRCDKWVKSGTNVSSYYDPLLAKVIVTGTDRADVIAKSKIALAETRIAGFETNLGLMRQILEFDLFADGNVHTRMLNGFTYEAATIEVLTPGTQTTVQDFPARLGFWGVGVPPSGPMDSFNFRLANKIVGNNPLAAGLEMTLIGGTYQFNTHTTIALAGGELPTSINGHVVNLYEAIEVHPGDVLEVGTFTCGQRAYLAIRGGIDVPEYMGSRSTFILGKFGGHAGRGLIQGDILHIGSDVAGEVVTEPIERPAIAHEWEIGVMIGPHGAPEFFKPTDVETFFATDWEVHYNSSRTGVRLIGPAPEWAREDGGEAGLHPSNIHDNAYAIGSIDYTGDMPVMLGPDGPSLGGFVCPATVVEAELWKMGQLRAGDKIRFYPVTLEKASELEATQEAFIETLVAPAKQTFSDSPAELPSAIVKELPEHNVVYRCAGDKYLLIEYGELQIDMEMRFRAHRMELALEEATENGLIGLIDVTAGIRSLQLHYDSRVLPRQKLLDLLEEIEVKLATDGGKRRVPSRIVHMPLSWDDITARMASEKYTQSVRADAPWCPDNKEFIRRINGLDSVKDVYDVVYGADYLVMGLGDVYLGAPVSTPLDPRHRLVTTKYNPARTWTAENAVGIGGAYLGIYGMEGPGGYQLVGRTSQTWNTYNKTEEFTKPWLFRCFDKISFYPVTHEELTRIRRELPHGAESLKIEESYFDLDEYLEFLDTNKPSIVEFKQKQQAAFDAERNYWVENGLLNFQVDPDSISDDHDAVVIPDGATCVTCPVGGSLWQMNVEEGQTVEEGDVVAILECMKTEIKVFAPLGGIVAAVFGTEGAPQQPGQELIAIQPHTGA